MPDGTAQFPALPADLDVEHARLPAVYEGARLSLRECTRIDECQTWANKAEALASYARQMNDTALREMADRIQARAIRRAGELLQEIPPGQGARDGKRQEGALPPLTRTEAATDAGLSEHQRKTSLRVANVPPAEFEAAVEASGSITVTELAERGKRASTTHLGGRDPDDYREATRLIGTLSRFNREAAEIDLGAAIRGCWPIELEAVRQELKTAIAWLDQAVPIIGGADGL